MIISIQTLALQKKMAVAAGSIEKVDVSKKLQKQEAEERRLAEMMIPKKKKRLYNKIMYSKKKKAQEVRGLVVLVAKIDDYPFSHFCIVGINGD